MKTISTDEIKMMNIGLYRNVHEQHGYIVSVEDYFNKFSPACKSMIDELRMIKDHDEQRQYKSVNLPAATFSCICGVNKSQIISRNDIIVIDIDLVENQFLKDEDTLSTYKRKIFDLPYVYAVSKSCSGNGIFVIVIIENTDNDKFVNRFKSLEVEFKEQFNLVIDAACKNVNRLRYISYDNDLLIKDNTVIEYFDEVFIEEVVEYKPLKIKSNNDLIYDEEFVFAAINTLIDMGYSADTYFDWLIEAFRLSALGEIGLSLFIRLSQNSSRYTGDKDAEKQFNICQQKTKISWEEAVVYYYGKAKKLLGKNWIQIIKK